MILRIFTLILAAGMISCERSEQFLPPTPPPPPRYTKDYKMSVNTSELAAQEVDILWVIDNSGSMAEEQAAVRANSAQFMQAFTSASRLRWRMGLLSTDISQPPFLGFNPIVDWQTVDAVGQFNAAVSRLGTGGSGTEMLYDPVLKALKGMPTFLRKGAFFVLIVVTDEPEQSLTTTPQFIGEIRNMMGGSDKFATFAVMDPNMSSNQTYNDIVRITKGKTYNILSNDYGVLLAELGKDLVQRVMNVNPVILLDQRPKVETIQVIYKGRFLIPAQQWTYDPIYNLVRIQDPAILDATNLNVRVSFELAE